MYAFTIISLMLYVCLHYNFIETMLSIDIGSVNKVDCVYLSHPTTLLSIFHLPFGFQTFASQPFSEKWYIQVMLPIVFPIMLMLRLFASPFIVATHFIGKNFELQTWMIPRFKYQVSDHCHNFKTYNKCASNI